MAHEFPNRKELHKADTRYCMDEDCHELLIAESRESGFAVRLTDEVVQMLKERAYVGWSDA